jgi:hypothetical protein
MANDKVVQLLSRIILELKSALPDNERQCGWDEDLWSKCRERLTEIQIGIAQGTITKDTPSDFNLPRSLDHEGVTSGAMLDLIVQFQSAYDEEFTSHV